MKPTPFSRVYDRACELMPNLAPRHNSIIHVWLEEGCDVDKDIIPCLERVAKTKPGMSSFSYFTGMIRDARDSRRRAEEAFAEKAALTPIAEANKAEAIKFQMKMGIKIPENERWLRSYEAVNGEVRV